MFKGLFLKALRILSVALLKVVEHYSHIRKLKNRFETTLERCPEERRSRSGELNGELNGELEAL